MTTAQRLDVAAEVVDITAARAARRDPGYEWGMRRTVPSAQPAHAVRRPLVQKTAVEWRRAHKAVPPDDLFALCEALWATGWREERIVAIDLIRRSRGALAAVAWGRLEGWSAEIDNWELVDNLAEVTGRLLIDRPALLLRVKALSASENPWQRRLALVTLIRAFVKADDGRWRAGLTAMAEALRKDPHPLVRRAVVWALRQAQDAARDRLAKDHALSAVEGHLDG